MSTQPITAQLPRSLRRQLWAPRLVSAEFLKLRKRRGLVLTALALAVVPMVIAHTVLGAQDQAVGGLDRFVGAMDLLGGMTIIASILVGSTLGTGDLSAGVFRELVVTGRSRLLLFAARVPAGLGLLILVVAAGFAVTATFSIALAGGQGPVDDGHGGLVSLGNAAPSGLLLLESFGWLALVAASIMVVALGVSSLLRSRGTSIGVLLGWYLVVMPLLLDPGARLGSLRVGLFYAAADRLKPDTLFAGATPGVAMSLGAAVAVLLSWALVPLSLGAWRTCTRDA